jgi:YggT family protein
VITLIYVLYLAAMIYGWLIVIRAVLSWFRPRPGSLASIVYRVLSRLTDPYLRLFRRAVPIARIGSVGVDLSSVVALVVLFIVIEMLVRL